MVQTCAKCGSSFEITNDDLKFYDKVSPVINEVRYPFPSPTFCPECRLQRKLCFRNEKVFYKRKCDLTGRNILSIYAPDKDRKVYDQKVWWSDEWDPLEYGRDFDFSRPFFDQFAELWREVPLINLWNLKCENAEYNNNCFNLKNSFMSINSDEGERILYCYVTEFCNDCTDTSFLHNSELCYECVDCTYAYNCTFSRLLDNCHDCHFSSDLIGCSQCFGCHGLRQQTHCLFNKKVTQEEWNKFMNSVEYTNESIQKYKNESEKIRLTVPQICTKQVQCENCSGNFLYKCKDVHNSFDVHNGEHCKNIIYAPLEVKYIQDAYALGGVELGYEFMSGGIGAHHVAFINGLANGLNDSFYCVLCGNGSEHLFGCISMKKRSYCILNKQYSKEKYFELVPKIIEHMRKTPLRFTGASEGQAGEYGEFFPPSISPFDYNETLANDLFPLAKEEALAKGYKWKDNPPDTPQAEKVIKADQLPAKINDIPDDILNWAIECEATGKQFKIVPQELAFYRKMRLPMPRLHPEERCQRRMKSRPPRKLWKRTCIKCGKEIMTSYSPEGPERVYCERCYLEAVY